MLTLFRTWRAAIAVRRIVIKPINYVVFGQDVPSRLSFKFSRVLVAFPRHGLKINWGSHALPDDCCKAHAARNSFGGNCAKHLLFKANRNLGAAIVPLNYTMRATWLTHFSLTDCPLLRSLLPMLVGLAAHIALNMSIASLRWPA